MKERGKNLPIHRCFRATEATQPRVRMGNYTQMVRENHSSCTNYTLMLGTVALCGRCPSALLPRSLRTRGTFHSMHPCLEIAPIRKQFELHGRL